LESGFDTDDDEQIFRMNCASVGQSVSKSVVEVTDYFHSGSGLNVPIQHAAIAEACTVSRQRVLPAGGSVTLR